MEQLQKELREYAEGLLSQISNDLDLSRTVIGESSYNRLKKLLAKYREEFPKKVEQLSPGNRLADAIEGLRDNLHTFVWAILRDLHPVADASLPLP
jgi:hypothetical protein